MINMCLKKCEAVLVIVLFSSIQLVDNTSSRKFVAEDCDKNLFRRLTLSERMLEFENHSDVVQIFAVKQRTPTQHATVKSVKELDDPTMSSKDGSILNLEEFNPWPLIYFIEIVACCIFSGMILTAFYQLHTLSKSFLKDEMLYEEMELKKSESLENILNVQAQRILADKERKRKKEEADALQRKLDSPTRLWTYDDAKEDLYKSKVNVVQKNLGSSSYDPFFRRSSFPPDHTMPHRFGQYGLQYGPQRYNNQSYQMRGYGSPTHSGQIYNGLYGRPKYGMGSSSYPEIHHPRRVRMLIRR